MERAADSALVTVVDVLADFKSRSLVIDFTTGPTRHVQVPAASYRSSRLEAVRVPEHNFANPDAALTTDLSRALSLLHGSMTPNDVKVEVSGPEAGLYRVVADGLDFVDIHDTRSLRCRDPWRVESIIMDLRDGTVVVEVREHAAQITRWFANKRRRPQ